MALVLKNLKLPLTADESSLKQLAARALAMPEDAVKTCRVLRVSTDARKKEDIYQLYTLHITMEAADEKHALARGGESVELAEESAAEPLVCGDKNMSAPIVVVGMGPAGLLAGYMLSAYGYRPILIERGRDMQSRRGDVDRFCSTGILDPHSNVMFGEGGAGAFSDGKLTTRIKDPRAEKVLELLIRHGAPPEIGVQAKPHIGTDGLSAVVVKLRKEILRLGGEVRFETCLTGLDVEAGAIRAVRVQTQHGMERIPCCACILAIGQGARDTYEMLAQMQLELVPKAFAVGVRIEHPREMIDRSQFGRWAGHPRLGAAEYRLSAEDNGRGVYTFCMCPGGIVIPSASEEGQAVTNGMSYYARDGENSNAAIVVQVGPQDYGPGPLAGVRFQEKLERDAYKLGGGGFVAPACCAGDLLAGRAAQGFGGIRPTYRPGVAPRDLSGCLPDYVFHGIQAGVTAFARRLRGFATPEAVITAVESRTSAPVRILRGETGEATRCAGLYPVGEGAGYAGGIVSAAVDGMRAAERIMAIYKP